MIWLSGDPHPSDEEVDQIIEKFDLNGNQVLAKHRFKSLFRLLYERREKNMTLPREQINLVDIKNALRAPYNYQ